MSLSFTLYIIIRQLKFRSVLTGDGRENVARKLLSFQSEIKEDSYDALSLNYYLFSFIFSKSIGFNDSTIFQSQQQYQGCNLMANTRLNFNVSKRQEIDHCCVLWRIRKGLQERISLTFMAIPVEFCSLPKSFQSNLFYVIYADWRLH